jgi:hypothetical protein
MTDRVTFGRRLETNLHVNRVWLIAVVLALIVARMTMAVDSQGPQRAQDWQLVFGRDFLWAMLPELQDHRYLLNAAKDTHFDFVWPPMAPLDLTVSAIRDSKECQRAHESPDAYPQCLKVVLRASYVFHPNGTLSELHIHPVKQFKAADSRVHNEVEQHPEWTEHQIAVALEKAGASALRRRYRRRGLRIFRKRLILPVPYDPNDFDPRSERTGCRKIRQDYDHAGPAYPSCL